MLVKEAVAKLLEMDQDDVLQVETHSEDWYNVLDIKEFTGHDNDLTIIMADTLPWNDFE